MGAPASLLRRPGPGRGPGRDAVVAGIAAIAGTALVTIDSTSFGHVAGLPPWALVGIQVVAASTLFARRSAPLTVAAANAALAIPTATVAAVVATYAAVAYAVGTARVRVVTVALVVVAARPWKVDVSRAGGDDDFTVHFQLMLFPVVIAALLGWRHRRAQARDARAARDRAMVAERARADERARLAAEMHDVITHRVSLMVLQAGALQVSTADDTVRRHANELRRSGRQALRELRDLLSVIRDEAPDDPARSPEPAVLDLADLIASSRGVGVPVTLVTSGTVPELSTVVARTAYRVVQEALTNVRKHAPGAEVWMSVRYDADSLRLTIRNTAVPAPVESSLAGTGANGGLHGLRRRVELVNGSLRAGPRADGGFEVSARLPIGMPE